MYQLVVKVKLQQNLTNILELSDTIEKTFVGVGKSRKGAMDNILTQLKERKGKKASQPIGLLVSLTVVEIRLLDSEF